MKKYWVWLSSLDKVFPVSRLKLLEYFKEPENIWDASEKGLRELGFLSEAAIKQIISKDYRTDISRHMENIERTGIEVVTIRDGRYPLYLKNIYDPPAVLYVKGTLAQDEKSIAIVGSRKATSYGAEIGEELAYQLASLGLTIVSGMARGIDSCAHRGALGAKGRTIGALGCGHDIVYPSENKSLMENIIKSGAVVSEYLPGTLPLPRNFPARNRVISGLSLGVVIVEAAENSGSLITAAFALEQGREVFALPGDINRVNSQGSNKLIQDGAKLVTCVEDVLEELQIHLLNNTMGNSNSNSNSNNNNGNKHNSNSNNKNNSSSSSNNNKNNNSNSKSNSKSKSNNISNSNSNMKHAKLNAFKRKNPGRGLNNRAAYGNLDNDEWRIVENLMHEPMHIDALVNSTGYDIKNVNCILTMLELKGIVEQEQGSIYKLKRQYK